MVDFLARCSSLPASFPPLLLVHELIHTNTSNSSSHIELGMFAHVVGIPLCPTRITGNIILHTINEGVPFRTQSVFSMHVNKLSAASEQAFGFSL